MVDLMKHVGKQVRAYFNSYYFPHGDNNEMQLRTIDGELQEIDKKFIVIDDMVIYWRNILFLETKIQRYHKKK